MEQNLSLVLSTPFSKLILLEWAKWGIRSDLTVKLDWKGRGEKRRPLGACASVRVGFSVVRV